MRRMSPPEMATSRTKALHLHVSPLRHCGASLSLTTCGQVDFWVNALVRAVRMHQGETLI